ncbi:MAG TPA: metallophosphoesterase family protein [Gaiellaceae bacterium]|nr:metallophosphoesterase family protein [Gaiellaceae bacterium]
MIATLYDIHGNLAALEAVLDEVPDDATIVIGGDVVAGGPQPSETLELLRGSGARVSWLRGNTDRELDPNEPGLAPPGALDATRAALTEEQTAFLLALPPTLQIGRTLYCHASPRNDIDIFTEQTPDEQIAFLFENVDADVVVCGHTHMQFDRMIAGKRVVNSGSVGRPYGDEAGAFWTLDLEPRRTQYAGMQAPEMNREEWLAYCAPHEVRS